MFFLIYFLLAVGLSIIGALVGFELMTFGLNLIVLIPHIALTARRLHDTGKSGWWQLIVLIPFIGWLILLVLLVLKGDQEANQYGPSPYGAETTPTGPQPIEQTPPDSAV